MNYALVRVHHPRQRRDDRPVPVPYLIIDQRAGHGPGIGGFKEDSQVGVVLRAGYPVYFVIFFPKPVPGQTIRDVVLAQGRFVEEVAARHPNSPKPVIFGNCQGGWSVMLLASAAPELTGPLVINGAPMSYWNANLGGGPAKAQCAIRRAPGRDLAHPILCAISPPSTPWPPSSNRTDRRRRRFAPSTAVPP